MAPRPRRRIESRTVIDNAEVIDIAAGLAKLRASQSSDDDISDAGTGSEPRVAGRRQISAQRQDYTIVELEEALRSAQKENLRLQTDYRKLAASFAQIETKYKALKQRTASEKTASAISTIKNDDDEIIASYARKFGVMNECVVPLNAFLQKHSRYIHSDDPNRWESENTKLQCIVAELYEELPSSLHLRLETSVSFRTTFHTAISAQRRTIIHKLRTQTAGQIFEQEQVHYISKSDRSNVFKYFLRFKGKEFSKIAPILFPPGKDQVELNRRTIFQNPALPLLIRSILFGPSSLNGTKPPSTSTVGRLWGVTEVTPGAISFAAVLAVFLHSPDERFEEYGHKTKINYLKLFSYYKQIIMTKLHAKDADMQALFIWYNQEIFHWHEAKKGKNNKENDGDSSGVDEFLAGDVTAADIQYREEDDTDRWYTEGHSIIEGTPADTQVPDITPTHTGAMPVGRIAGGSHSRSSLPISRGPSSQASTRPPSPVGSSEINNERTDPTIAIAQHSRTRSKRNFTGTPDTTGTQSRKR